VPEQRGDGQVAPEHVGEAAEAERRLAPGLQDHGADGHRRDGHQQ